MKPYVVLTALLLVVPVFVFAPADADNQQGSLLVDYGNGSCIWIDGLGHGTLTDVVSDALSRAGIEYEKSSDGFQSVNGISTVKVQDVECSWRFYIWTSASYSWSYGETDGSRQYTSGYVAIGFYSSNSVVPASTPYYKETWTQAFGDSSSSYFTHNTAPDTVATPLEWTFEGTHGNIDTSLLFADGLLYFIAGGSQSAIGDSNKPCIYCIDTETHEIAWSETYVSNTGYEIMSPLIVGSLLIVSSGNAHVYAYDRMTGDIMAELVPEGESPIKAELIDTTYYELENIFDSEGNILISGPSRITGATTPVYDSGLLYFNTYDGAMHCFSIDSENGFKEIWRYMPEEDSDRGAFYSNPPVVTVMDDGSRIVLAGSYAGRIYCVDADTGFERWIKQIVSFNEKNPGAISGISICPDDRILVCATDGNMSVSAGCLMTIDLTSGEILWELNVYGKMTVVGNVAYGYAAKSISGDSLMYDKHGTEEKAVSGFYALRVSDGRYIWKNESLDTTKSGMVYSDGRLYCIDYSPGTDWPSGGAVRCIDAETGAFVWSIKVEPFDGMCYSMSAVTIVDGKIYAANDGGYIYCLSTISSKVSEGSAEIDYRSSGLMHWSWIALILSSIAVGIVSVLLYRK